MLYFSLSEFVEAWTEMGDRANPGEKERWGAKRAECLLSAPIASDPRGYSPTNIPTPARRQVVSKKHKPTLPKKCIVCILIGMYSRKKSILRIDVFLLVGSANFCFLSTRRGGF